MNVLTEAVQTTLIGMLVVFVGLTILILIIGLIRFLSGREEKTTQAAPAVANEASAEPQALAPAVDLAIAAAIAAAVSMVLEAEGQTSGFVVRRIRRINR